MTWAGNMGSYQHRHDHGKEDTQEKRAQQSVSMSASVEGR